MGFIKKKVYIWRLLTYQKQFMNISQGSYYIENSIHLKQVNEYKLNI